MASDDSQSTGIPHTVAERRARMTDNVREWCRVRQVPNQSGDLSDQAALLIATGYVDEETREIVLNRRREGRAFPSAGGFSSVRRLADDHARLVRKLDESRSGPAQLIVRFRMGEAERKLSDVRSAFVLSRTHYASGVLAIRRDRKAGLHLDLEQRSALFRALQRTPVPLDRRSTPADQLRSAARDAAIEGMRRLSDKSRLAGFARAASERIALGPNEYSEFDDQYETLLYLAGTLFDRIHGSLSWHSGYFMVQRAQLDLASELVQIAVDTVALRGISRELEDALVSARDAASRQQIRARQGALESVWNELVNRVAALMRIDDALSEVEERLRSFAAVQRAENLDHRIDDLLSRSGTREMSAENIHHVSEQVAGVDEVIAGYQELLYGDIAELTGRDNDSR
ncbi:hypothetical protein [Hoyosella subflava]|uniref:Uncharacterized protein n=1 Tax=Hoyosella subflava (strain DSM 45089 / JCM 17490 / NBRC 109087 / DQS3-9A1) TaxID=443218 RepID=F6EHC4_HOYSD|nr:hypothetical protein [Hoyosella subflava]AEF41103.1 hypothetical protein AS9A_2656 [Hoyosella subflava DQS3-9A1]